MTLPLKIAFWRRKLRKGAYNGSEFVVCTAARNIFSEHMLDAVLKICCASIRLSGKTCVFAEKDLHQNEREKLGSVSTEVEFHVFHRNSQV